MGWNKVTIKKYYELHTIARMIKDPIELNIRLLACFRETTRESIERLTIKQLSESLREIDFLKELPDNTKLPIKIRCKGDVYMPLILTEGMTGGQFIDFTSICKDEKPEDYVYHIHDLLGAMCVKREWMMSPPFIKYEYKGYEKTATIFHDHMTMDIAYPFYLFFCNVLINLQKPMLDYSQENLRKEISKAKKLIKKSKSELITTPIGVGR